MPQSKFQNYLLLLLFAIVGGFTACENSIEAVNNLNEQFKPAIETATAVKLVYSEKGNVKVELYAPQLLRHKVKEPYIEFPEGLEVKFFNEQLRNTGQMTAKYGLRYEKDEKVIVRDSVVWINTRKETLEADELIWDERNKSVYSDKFVKITTEYEELRGTGFEANQDFTKYRIRNPEGKKAFDPNEFDK